MKTIAQQPFAPMAWLGIYQNAEVIIFFSFNRVFSF